MMFYLSLEERHLRYPKGRHLFVLATYTTGMVLYHSNAINLTRTFSSLPSLWGDDAEEWNPARFLDNPMSVSLGVYANL